MKKNKKIKGEPGYFRYRKKKLLAGSLSGFLLMFLFFFTGYLIYGTARNLITILAVLVVLPTVKIYVQYIMIPWKNNADAEYFNNIKNKFQYIDIYAELLITGSEKSFEITYLAIDKNENIIAYTENDKADASKFEKAVTNFLNYYNYNAKVKMYNNLNSFEEKLTEISDMAAEPTNEQKEHMGVVFEKISIMSI